jgi:anaerobic magnesium-protoporphyrin IX monomethyl ester cyclase
MKILVANEPFVRDFCRTQRWAARTRGRVLRAPDWLAYATAVLERDLPHALVRLIDFPALDWDKAKYRSVVEREQPDVVVLDSTTPSIASDIECARIAKEVAKSKVIMVGPHISAVPEETLTAADGAIDVACLGEYDFSVRDAVRALGDPGALAEVPGLCYMADGQPRRTAKRPLIADLDSLPFPAWHQLDLMRYFDGGKLYPYIDVISGRGCPNQCVFCLWPQVMHGLHYRLRSPGSVVDELERDIALCPQVRRGEFFFEDDTFTVNRERAMSICDEILRRGLRITFSVNARADTADRELFRLMKRAGCRELLVGFESGTQDVLNKMHKRITIEQSQSFVRLAHEERLHVHGCFVIGLPGESEQTAAQTVDFALGLDLDTLQFSGAVPFPGTSLFAMCEREGWLTTRDWTRWLDAGEQAGVVSYPWMTMAQINHWVDEGLRRFYLRPSFMLKFLLSTRSRSDLYRKVRGAWNYFSYILERRA